ncbi:MAG: type II secretion system protein [Fimbriimonas sp.]|jgi:prepilin-type N-terminal cleavage/methylation domain-containing protein|nr:type II secretion system protein [Fimbriimonas sp.]
MSRRRGASLTELLVCLVVISIVVAFLSPALVGVKSKAKTTVDISNMRQLYAAAKLYQADFETYPLRSNPTILYDSYLGGTKPVCTSGSEQDSEYALYGYHDLLLRMGMKNDFDYYERCRETRQGDFPLVQDRNHRSVVQQYRGLGSYLLIVRENGKFESLSKEQIDSRLTNALPTLWPCPRAESDFLDVNY